MTDAEINALVAKLIERQLGVGEQSLAPRNVMDYCNDPAAWGALFVWLADNNHTPELNHTRVSFMPHYQATVYGRMIDGDTRDVKPGRALAIAALRAHGVEVE